MDNPFRKNYRELTDFEKKFIGEIKDKATELFDMIDTYPETRENSLAKTKLEESVMWIVKQVTE